MTPFDQDKTAKIYVAGHRGMVGSAIVRALNERGFENLILRTSQELDLREQTQVREFFNKERPAYVFLAAAKVGGIVANDTYPAEFIYENLAIQTNVIHAAHLAAVKKLLFLGSTCIYPRLAAQPLKEESLLTGPLEPTNEWYAIAKIAGIKMCQAYRQQYGSDFISAMPTNLYGPGDNYHPENSHVVPGMIYKMHEAKTMGQPHVQLWGSGRPLREFLYVEDLAEACVFLMQHYSAASPINVGTGIDLSIRELAEILKKVTGYTGELLFDTSRPDGTPRKLVDTKLINDLGWKSGLPLVQGLELAYEAYLGTLEAGVTA